METVLKSKVFNWSQPANPATTLTAILVLNYMKTFDNPDTIDFRKGISAYSNKWHLQDYQPIYGYSDCYRDKVALLMNRELLTRINLPIVELLIGETIKETTQSYVWQLILTSEIMSRLECCYRSNRRRSLDNSFYYYEWSQWKILETFVVPKIGSNQSFNQKLLVSNCFWRFFSLKFGDCCIMVHNLWIMLGTTTTVIGFPSYEKTSTLFQKFMPFCRRFPINKI